MTQPWAADMVQNWTEEHSVISTLWMTSIYIGTFRLFILKAFRNCKFRKIKNCLKMFIYTFQCFRWTNPQKFILLTTTDMHRFSRGSRTFDQINGCKVCLRVIGIITCHLSHVMITAVIHCLVRKLIRIVYCSWVILFFIKFQFAPLLFFEKYQKVVKTENFQTL